MPVDPIQLRIAIQDVYSEVEGEYVATIEAAGFVDIEVAWRGKPFTGAPGQSKADTFDAEGVNIRARKP